MAVMTEAGLAGVGATPPGPKRRSAYPGWFFLPAAIIYGVLPQVLPNFVSFSLWRFEINVRSATIIGFVGAGGIGMELYEALRLNYFDDVGAILLIIAATVMMIDVLSEWLRGRLTGQASFDQTVRSVQP